MERRDATQIWLQPTHKKVEVSAPYITKGAVDSSGRNSDSYTSEYLYHSGFTYTDSTTGDDSGYDLSADDDAYTDSSDGALDTE